MFVRNLLQPGDFVEFVPMGLNVTLEYGDNGVLEKAFFGFDEARDHQMNDGYFQDILDRKLVPISIPIRGGTTWVRGTFVSADIRPMDGVLPEAIRADLLHAITNPRTAVKFLAMDVSSRATKFAGIQAIRTWLQMNRFRLLPFGLMPVKITLDSLMTMVCSAMPEYAPVVQTYVIFRNTETIIQDSGVRVEVITQAQRIMDDHGCFHLVAKCGEVTHTVPYGEAVHFNMKLGTRIYLTEAGRVFYSESNSMPMSNSFTCPRCGNTIFAAYNGDTCCQDPACTTHLYSQYLHFCNVCKLDAMASSKFEQMITDGHMLMLSDVLELEEYEGMEWCMTLAELLDCLIPSDQLRDRTILPKFTGKCNNSSETVQYYIGNPDKIQSSLDMSGPAVDQLVAWFSQASNVLLVQTFLSHPNVMLDQAAVRFDGDPIFRGMKLTLTGDFQHGSMDDVSAILRSYSAEVYPDLRDSTSMVIIGDLQENVNGAMLRKARKAHVPTMTEKAFFDMYGLDQDLKDKLQ